MSEIVKNNVAELNSDLSKQVAVLREDIVKLTAIVADYGKLQSDQIKSTVAQKAADLAESSGAALNSAKSTAKVAYSEAEEAVRENPASAVGLAAALGFLVGIMTSRR
jgi:ElaB/YqjD/DUF883 family membrane-anchored ribosome-binding protein